VRLVTQIDRLRVPAAPIAVPASLDQVSLAQVVCHLLGIEAISLEFYAPSASADSVALLDGAGGRSLLRGTLTSYAQAMGLAPESTITLEYAPSVLPPRPGPSLALNDWISALAGSERFVV
jgi:hypothetical protein